MADAGLDLKQHVIPLATPVQPLQCREAFALLSAKERLYAYYVSQAAWMGSLATLVQTSPESPLIFVFLLRLFHAPAPLAAWREACFKAGVSKEDLDALLVYAAGFFGNMGNYKSFGDTKFVPQLSNGAATLAAIVEAAQAQRGPAGRDAELDRLWAQVRGPMFSLAARERQLGLGAAMGVSTYFSYNCTEADAQLAQRFMVAHDISPYNTRLFKHANPERYEVRLASAVAGASGTDPVAPLVRRYTFEGRTFEVTRGDYAPFMAAAADALEAAIPHAANATQQEMLQHYANSFRYGSIESHKDGSRAWIKDKGPAIESYIGFIESYRDPFGTRGEFEGFVAMVNRIVSQRFQALVESAEQILTKLPWPPAFEKDKFLRPDFTSLDILTFAGSGIPAGINIPNYDDIRQSEGFKNVSLGNVLAARNAIKDVPCVRPEDLELYRALQGPAFDVQVGLHELLGHGSGKLLKEEADGKRNFAADLIDPETGGPVASWYKPGETYDSVFTAFGSAYEECKAECVGLHLCLDHKLLSIFGHTDSAKMDDIIYINWLSMCRAGLLALVYYTPETMSWRQAHMQARYVILRVLMEAGQGFVKTVRVTADDGQPDCWIELDRTKIESVGKPAIAAFLRKLQVFKSTADVRRAGEMFLRYSQVGDDMLALRPIVQARERPRPLFLQPLLRLNGQRDDVTLTEFDASADGLVQSFQARFDVTQPWAAQLLELAQRDAPHFV